MRTAIDLVGQTFGRLTVVSRKDGGSKPYWHCRCICGNLKAVRGDCLRDGTIQSCGCLMREMSQHNGGKNAVDITGNTYGRLTVLRQGERKKNGINWVCQCSCGKLTQASVTVLNSGKKRSCGCLHLETAAATGKQNEGKFEDLTGQVFGRLTVVASAGKHKGNYHSLCKCECGNDTTTRNSGLLNGHTTSCGCYRIEQARAAVYVNGLSHTREYIIAYSQRRREYKALKARGRRALKVYLQEDVYWTIEMEKTLVLFQPTCVLCGGVATSTDHVNPLASGHTLKPGNATRLCRSCNSHKGAKPLDDLPEDERTKLVKAASDFYTHWQELTLEKIQ